MLKPKIYVPKVADKLEVFVLDGTYAAALELRDLIVKKGYYDYDRCQLRIHPHTGQGAPPVHLVIVGTCDIGPFQEGVIFHHLAMQVIPLEKLRETHEQCIDPKIPG